MKNLKSALKNVGWMILAMALVQALSLIIHPVTAGEAYNPTGEYHAIEYGDTITDDGDVIPCDDVDAWGDDDFSEYCN